ncbi:MAG TPA: hypothetical protein VNA68_01845 [Candidatus Dormibacteraeota bacterium]|nr:hypothetical protein [Candidatus Dormibacteraeota bacterium]
MDSVNIGLSFWQIIGIIFAAAISIIAVKITLSFDFNKYLERKDKKLAQKLKNACTHMEMTPSANNQFQLKSLFESPSGTLQWQCQRCGGVRNHNNDYEERAQYYADNPDKYIEQNKKFQKLLKKSGMI